MEFADLFDSQTEITEMPFGKYKGTPIADIPDSYLIWLHENVNMNDMLKEAVVNTMICRYKKMVAFNINVKEPDLYLEPDAFPY